MNSEKVVFAFFIVLALTLNFGFYLGDIDNPEHHHIYELFAVIVVNLIATVMKFGDRTQMGAVLLATSLVALLQLFAAVLVWTVAVRVTGPLTTAFSASPDYLAANGTPESIEELSDHRIVIYGDSPHPTFPKVNWLRDLALSGSGGRRKPLRTVQVNN